MLWRFNRAAVTAAIVWTCFGIAPATSEAGPPKKEVNVIIAFKAPPGKADHDFVTKQGGKIKHSYWIVPAIAARIPEQALAAFAKNPNVSAVEQDVEVTAHDLELDNSWGVKKIGEDIARAAGQTGAGVKVAVIDTGIDYTHPDLAANYKGGWDFVNNDAYPMDDHSHGTHCAGTIAALANGVGVVGVAPNCDLYAVKVLNSSGSGSFSTIIAGVQWCVQHGIQVTSNSYGSTTDPGSTAKQAFDNAAAAGLVMVASAGNSGGGTDTVGYPAKYASVIAVAGTDQNDAWASWSSTGPAVELAAPGVSIYSTMPGGGYGSKSGTSMACPHVAGAAAVLIGAGLTSNADVRYVLDMSSLDLGTAGVDNTYGYGRVNIATALSALATQPPPPPPSDPPPSSDPPPPETIGVDYIGYSMYGGKTNNKNLRVEVDIVDDAGAPVPNATVAVKIMRGTSVAYTGSAVTDANGTASFTISSARSGTYATIVTNVTATGCVWDQLSPANSFAK